MHDMNKKIIRYMTLPQVVPRLHEFLTSGFGWVAFYMAQAYRAARLLPVGHPYLSSANIGRYGIRHVVAEAASNLVWKKQNIDQIFIFGLILAGLVILIMQFCLLGLGLGTQVAQATMPGNYAEFFVTQNPDFDIAFILLDRVFGIPDIFNSCVMQGIPCNVENTNADPPYPFHAALRAVLQYYSIGLLVIAVLIFTYFITAVLAETAQTGTPFGKRFNHVWAPLRIVMALGLLVPLGTGLNAAQYITLYAAKWGSGFATNGWILFVNTAVTGEATLLGDRERLIVTPGTPPINELVVFFSAVATCVRSERLMNNGKVIDAWLMNPNTTAAAPRQLATTDYVTARDTYYGTSLRNPPSGGGGVVYQYDSTKMLIYFGERDPGTAAAGGTGERTPQHRSRIQLTEPTCGSIGMEITDVDTAGSPGSQYVLQQYYEMIQALWAAANIGGAGGGGGGADLGNMGTVITQIGTSMPLRYLPLEIKQADAPLPTMQEMRDTMEGYEQYVANAIEEAVRQQEESSSWVQDLTQRGWAGAAIWYNQIATLNGAMMGAVYNLPLVYRYPKIMEEVREIRTSKSQTLQGRDRFRPYQANNRPVRLGNPADLPMAEAMYWSTVQWDNVGADSTGNFLVDMVKAIFGLDGLFNMRDNELRNIHPLAQLVGIGKSIINRSIANLGDAFIGFAVSQLAKVLDANPVGNVVTAIGGFQSSIAMMGLGIGFVLFYVVPFLPFIYFFFAVGAWIKTIFEAMVGVPLWALAHIRIDGHGLPGDAAMGGYYLILDIFLRPILIIFGLLASITIFAAQVRVLHEIWHLVVSNVAGMDKEAAQDAPAGLSGAIEWMRGPIDQFFYTVIYAIVVYMLGLSAFKLVDIIPQQIVRWMGTSGNAFQDNSGEAAGNLMRNSMMSNNFVQGHLSGAMKGAGEVVNAGTDKIVGK